MPNTVYSGFTQQTAENLLLDAGAFFVNYEFETDTFTTAVDAGKLLGATREGGQFAAIPEMRTIEVDGVKGKAKGLQTIDSWEVKLNANVLEVTVDGLAQALTASELEPAGIEYDKLTAKNYIALTDYIDNITWIGKKSGSDEPVIIQIYNALNSTGLTLETQDNNEAVINMEFEGHYDATNLDNPPFAIYYPKNLGGISGNIDEGGTPSDGATVSVEYEGETISTTTESDGTYLLAGVPAGTYTVTATDDAATDTATDVVVLEGEITENVDITIV